MFTCVGLNVQSAAYSWAMDLVIIF